MLLLLLAVLAACAPEPADPRPESLVPFARSYVTLLNAGDEPGLRELLANPAQPQDAAERIAAFGRRGLGTPTITWRSEFPGQYLVTITATDSSGGRTSRQEMVGWEAGHWVMGPLHARAVPGAPRTSDVVPPGTSGTSVNTP